VAWHAATRKDVDLVMVPLRMALWQRARDGSSGHRPHRVHHSDAGSQYTSHRLTEHLDLEGIAASIGALGDQAALALLRQQAGDTAGAEDAYRQAAAAGDPIAWSGLAWLRERAGDPQGGAWIRRYGITVNGVPETPWSEAP
jgi:transposase InsO family protein